MQDAKRAILDRVVAGEMSPQDAAIALEHLEGPTGGAPSATSPRGGSPDPEAGSDAPATSIRVVASMGSVVLLADRGVREAVCMGPHVARREGDVLVIESDQEGRGFRFGPWWDGRISADKLTIRVNPDLPIAAEISAGALRTQGLTARLSASVQAGSVRVQDHHGPFDLDVQAGSVHLNGRLESGESRLSCQAGTVHVHLETGSSVRISARSSLGKVVLPGNQPAAGFGFGPGRMLEAVVGAGAATLQVDAELGSVVVTA